MLVTDANDNVPVFESDAFEFTVREDAVSGEPLGSVTATDADSGRFGQVRHSNTQAHFVTGKNEFQKKCTNFLKAPACSPIPP